MINLNVKYKQSKCMKMHVKYDKFKMYESEVSPLGERV